jgi:hypothetical protein
LGENGRGRAGQEERVNEKGQNELGRTAMDFSTGEGGIVKGVRVGMMLIKLIV